VLASLSRAVARLEKRQLVKVFYGAKAKWTGIKITDAGSAAVGGETTDDMVQNVMWHIGVAKSAADGDDVAAILKRMFSKESGLAKRRNPPEVSTQQEVLPR
jgi:hypothetical protein